MTDGDGATGTARAVYAQASDDAIQVICLGSGGGPGEDNVTGFLVRSAATPWSKGSLLAVDAGSHLASITRILEHDFPLVSRAVDSPAGHALPDTNGEPPSAEAPPSLMHDESAPESMDASTRASSPATPITTLSSGPFAGLPFPYASARANAVHMVREIVSTYLITHPHLDHLSGFVINTASYNNTSRPKRLAALPFAVNAIKTHLFNDVIWPNLTDEDGGVGFVTFQRLTEGGNIALGEGTSRGYIEVCDGLAVKGFKVSHGHCMRGYPGHIHRGSNANLPSETGNPPQPHHQSIPNYASNPGPRDSLTVGRDSRSLSFSLPSQPGTPTFYSTFPSGQPAQQDSHCIVDSTAYFIRADASGREVLIFGDVEPDALSLSPRTHIVWSEAAPKIASGNLTGILIECSYADSQGDAVLFGHLAPRHLIAELQVLADRVREARRELERERMTRHASRKRKRQSNGVHGLGIGLEFEDSLRRRRRSTPGPLRKSSTGDASDLMVPVPMDRSESQHSPKSRRTTDRAERGSLPGPDSLGVPSLTSPAETPPLTGVTVVVIHVKDTYADGPLVGERILKELREHEERLAKAGKGLGCNFEVSRSGDSYWF